MNLQNRLERLERTNGRHRSVPMVQCHDDPDHIAAVVRALVECGAAELETTGTTAAVFLFNGQSVHLTGNDLALLVDLER